ncbi:multipass membrane protein [Cuniculiplasma divulgatum]|uniref:Multipass membrane protein n=2 Tax=Cuniculiplasma divulgatum TaxID=1673428 RepID=A0A1N5VZZ5_9ARCH|nr:multipass membrane protein [Cuniculiplasma divulgatum]
MVMSLRNSDNFYAIMFTVTSFIYLITGTILLSTGFVWDFPTSHRDPVFILLFFGFAVMIVFGMSYILIPNLMNFKVRQTMTKIQYFIYNIGLIISFLSMELSLNNFKSYFISTLLVLGLILLIISIAIHVWNISGVKHSTIGSGRESP